MSFVQINLHDSLLWSSHSTMTPYSLGFTQSNVFHWYHVLSRRTSMPFVPDPTMFMASIWALSQSRLESLPHQPPSYCTASTLHELYRLWFPFLAATHTAFFWLLLPSLSSSERHACFPQLKFAFSHNSSPDEFTNVNETCWETWLLFFFTSPTHKDSDH
jgi:hypothetical protein